MVSGCSSSSRKLPEIYRWGIQKKDFKKYDGFETLLVLDPSVKEIAKIKKNQNTVLGIVKLEGESLKQKIDLLISHGFDGVYFVPGSIAADEVITLSHYARMIHPDFIVLIENIHLLENEQVKTVVNAFVLKDVLLTESGGDHLGQLLKKKKKILSLEFLEDKNALIEYANLAKEKGLIPLVGHRPLKGKLIYSDQLFHLAKPCD